MGKPVKPVAAALINIQRNKSFNQKQTRSIPRRRREIQHQVLSNNDITS